MILGHLTVTYALRETFKERHAAFKPIVPLMIGAYLPDLIDKPLHLYAGFPGRGPAHSIFVLAVLFYTLFRFFPKMRNYFIPLALGVFLHLLQDIPDLKTVLWPFLGKWEHHLNIGIMQTVYLYYFKMAFPVPFMIEIASYPFCVYFLFKQKFVGGAEACAKVPVGRT